jgi:hypothetical protein
VINEVKKAVLAIQNCLSKGPGLQCERDQVLDCFTGFHRGNGTSNELLTGINDTSKGKTPMKHALVK